MPSWCRSSIYWPAVLARLGLPSAAMGSPVCGSIGNRWTVVSLLPVAIRPPSGLQATQYILPRWYLPRRMRIKGAVATWSALIQRVHGSFGHVCVRACEIEREWSEPIDLKNYKIKTNNENYSAVLHKIGLVTANSRTANSKEYLRTAILKWVSWNIFWPINSKGHHRVGSCAE